MNEQPMDRFAILADEIESLQALIANSAQPRDLDEEVAVIEVAALAERFGISTDLMRRRLREAGGKPFKIGKTVVIRKTMLLRAFEALEGGDL